MQKRFFCSLLSVIVTCMMMAQVVCAEDVYVTKYGKKYHKKDSRFIKGREVEKLTIEEAQARGYIPSSDFLEDESENEDKQEK